MTKRLLCVLLIAAMLLGVLTACGDETKKEKSKSTTTTKAATTTTTSAFPIYYVTADPTLNVRREPDTASERIGALPYGAAVELLSLPEPNYRLKKALDAVKDQYDVILIDCPPSLEVLTLNALAAADSILVPVQCEYFALEGLSDLMGTLRMVKKRTNPQLEIFGVALTMFDGRTNFSTQVAQEVRRHFPGKVFATAIPRNVRLAEAPSHGLPVIAYDKHSRGAVAYKAIAEELKKKL